MHKTLVYCFGGFGSLLLAGGILCLIAWKPLGNPPAPANAALGVVLILVFIIQALFNAWQDYSSSKVMASITTMLPDFCVVTRNGSQTSICGADLVPGDLVHIKLGDKIPADLRLLSVSLDLKFDRSVLTGESKPFHATIGSAHDNYLETHNIALQGTHCVCGSGIGIVVGILIRLRLSASGSTDPCRHRRDHCLWKNCKAIFAATQGPHYLAKGGAPLCARYHLARHFHRSLGYHPLVRHTHRP